MIVLNFSMKTDCRSFAFYLALEDFIFKHTKSTNSLEVDTTNLRYIETMLYEDKPEGTLDVITVDNQLDLDKEVTGNPTIEMLYLTDTASMVGDLVDNNISFRFEDNVITLLDMEIKDLDFVSSKLREDTVLGDFKYTVDGYTYDKIFNIISK